MREARKVGERLRSYGVLGRFGVDFVAVRSDDEWRVFAIEINLRKGGDLFDLAVTKGLHFDPSRQTGIVFHMLNALTELGLVGLTAVGNSHDEAERLHRAFVGALDELATERAAR